MRVLYIETNFVVGYAVGQRSKHDAIVSAAMAADAELRLPEVCIMEAIAAIDRKLNDYNSTGNAIRSRLRQLRDSVSSAAAGTAAVSLEAARLDLAAVDADVLSRRDGMLTSLANHGVFFRIDRGWFTDPSRRTLIDAPRDSMIVDAVVQDGAARQQEAVFYTENTADFDTPSVRATLLTSQVKLTERHQYRGRLHRRPTAMELDTVVNASRRVRA